MPYNPGVVNRSGEIMAAGISGAFGTVADTITELSKRAREAKAYRTMAVDGLGMEPEAVDKMNLEELQGHMQGVALKSSREHQQVLLANKRLENEVMQGRITSDKALPAAMMQAFPEQRVMNMGDGTQPAGPESFQQIMDGGLTLGSGRTTQPAPGSDLMRPRSINDRIASAIRTPGLDGSGMMQTVNAIRSSQTPALMMEKGPNGDRVYSMGGKMHVVPGEMTNLGTEFPTGGGGKVVQTGPKSGTYVAPKVENNAPESVFGDDSKEAHDQFQADMKKFKAGDAVKFKALRQAHLTELAGEKLSTPENNEWLYADDDKAFRAGLKKLTNAHERDAAIALRNKVIQASGKNNLLQLLMGGGMPAPAAAPIADAAVANVRKFNTKTGRIE